MAATGDERAFAEIVEACHRDVLRVCYTVCRDGDLADEAAQLTWVIVWRRLHTLRDPDRLRPWILAIAVNEARKMLKARKRHVIAELSLVDQADRSGAQSVGDIDLRNALARLSPDDRALLALRYVAGLSSTELASATKLTASGTRARLARLLNRLRKELS